MRTNSCLKVKSLVAAVLATFIATSTAQAQKERDYEPYPYTFVSVQGGVQETFTNTSFSEGITPVGAVSVGRFFSKALGFRFNVSGWKNKAGWKVNGTDYTYDFNYTTADLDLMFNLSNILQPKKYHPFNVILVGGVGLNYAWGCKGMDDAAAKAGVNETKAWRDKNHLSHNYRIGMMFEYNVAKHVGINLEVTANNLDDKYNAKVNGNSDWSATALLGITYKWGFKKKPAPAPVPVVVPQEVPAPVEPPVVVEEKEEPAPAPKPKETLKTEVFFTIGSSTVSAAEEHKVAELAQWLKQHPDAKVNLTGYADAGTGSAEVNQKVSSKRVETVKRLLTDKHGIDASRISTDYKGSTVQPYGDNDSNRVVIGLAEE